MSVIETDTVREVISTWGDITITEKVFMVIYNGTGPIAVTLPNVEDASGLIFVFVCEDDAIAFDNTVGDPDGNNIHVDAAALAQTVTMTAKGDYTVLYSDGNKWYQLAGQQT